MRVFSRVPGRFVPCVLVLGVSRSRSDRLPTGQVAGCGLRVAGCEPGVLGIFRGEGL